MRVYSAAEMQGAHRRSGSEGKESKSPAVTPDPIVVAAAAPQERPTTPARGWHAKVDRWVRARLAPKPRPKLSAKREVHELVTYLIFLSLFLLVLLSTGAAADEVYQFAASVRGQLTGNEFREWHSVPKKTFEDIVVMKEVYEFAEGPFYDSVYSSGTFDGDDSFATPAGDTRDTLNLPQRMVGLGYVVGAVRIGQVRSRTRDCGELLPPLFSNVPGDLQCLRSYSEASASHEAFGPGGMYAPRDYDEPGFTSLERRGYPAPEFAVELPPAEAAGCEFGYEYSEAEHNTSCPVKAEVMSLRQNKFFDLATRAIFFDLNVYSPSTDYFLTVRLFIEANVGGGLTSNAYVDALRLYPYHRTEDFVLLGLEVVVMLFVFYYIYEEIVRVGRIGLSAYVADHSNLPHALNMVLFIVVATCRVLSLTSLPSDIDMQTSDYVDLRSARHYARMANNVNCFNAFLCWLKVFRYLSFIPKFAQLTGTLSRAYGNVAGFAFIFVIVLVGSSQAFRLAFGDQLFSYHSSMWSFFTLLRTLLGDFDFHELVVANIVLGPLLFASFVCLVVFVLLNMFIAIVSDAYADTKEALKHEEDVALGALGKEIGHHILHNWLFRVPIAGRVLQEVYETAESVANDVAARGKQLATDAAAMATDAAARGKQLVRGGDLVLTAVEGPEGEQAADEFACALDDAEAASQAGSSRPGSAASASASASGPGSAQRRRSSTSFVLQGTGDMARRLERIERMLEEMSRRS